MALTGLFGGTFNPIHCGHLKAAEEVLRYFPLDRILFIPSYIPPHKSQKEVVAVEHRLRMVEIACQNQPKFLVSDVEARNPAPSYSIVTLRKLKEIYPEDRFFFIVGSDAFLEIETWKDYTELLKECSFIVVSRPGFGLRSVRGVIEKIRQENLAGIEKFSLLSPDELSVNGVYLLEINSPDISSSEIRKRLQSGLPITGLVPEGVEEYINKYNLYR
ncbi:MAG: nicotinate-nucleotide adenylyltransferase [Candidatus Aminicenantes bacterium]|nr:nicotinate-nucleotide adenylyltransferase [Candidatus Aminicenantes bacterium]